MYGEGVAAHEHLSTGQFVSRNEALSMSHGFDLHQGPDVPNAYQVGEVPTPTERHDYWNSPTEKHLYLRDDHEEKVAGLMGNLDELPPVVLNDKGGVGDGFHRAEAHRRAGRPTMRAFIPRYE